MQLHQTLICWCSADLPNPVLKSARSQFSSESARFGFPLLTMFIFCGLLFSQATVESPPRHGSKKRIKLETIIMTNCFLSIFEQKY